MLTTKCEHNVLYFQDISRGGVLIMIAGSID